MCEQRIDKLRDENRIFRKLVGKPDLSPEEIEIIRRRIRLNEQEIEESKPIRLADVANQLLIEIDKRRRGERALTREETCKRLGLSTRSFCRQRARLIASGLQEIRFGGCVRYRERSINEIIRRAGDGGNLC